MKRTRSVGTRTHDSSQATLAAWLQEWALDRALRDPDFEKTSPAAGEKSGRKTPMDYTVRPAVRDVVLLHPDDTPSADRPVYVALLDQAGPGVWLAAPFGRFATPATDGEWKTGRRAVPLRVLCLWNARWVSPAVIRRGWSCGRLTSREHDTARRVLMAWRDGMPLEARTRARIGPALVHPGDPRHVYEAEESRIMDEAAADADGRPENSDPAESLYEIPDSTWQKAAEPEDDGGRGPKTP